ARSGVGSRRSPTGSPRLKVETKAMQKAVHMSSAAPRTSSRPAKPPKPVYCLCRSTDSIRFMIACDSCEEWFHGDCVSVTASLAERIVAYYCEACRKRNRRLAVQYKPAASPTANSKPDAKHRRRGKQSATRKRDASEASKSSNSSPAESATRRKARNVKKQQDGSKADGPASTLQNGRGGSPSGRQQRRQRGGQQSRRAEPAQPDSSPDTARRRGRRRARQSPIRQISNDANDEAIVDEALDDSIDDVSAELVPDGGGSGGVGGNNGIVVVPDPPSLLSSPSAAAAAAAAAALGAVVSDVDVDEDEAEAVVVDADDIAVEEEMLLPAEDESATDDELETSGFRPPQMESDVEQDQNSLLDEDDFASTSVFRFPKRCGYCEACRLKADCGRCEVCQAKKRYPSFKLDSVDCLARQCRTMAKLGGRLGSLPFPIQKRGRGRPSKASLSNEYFLYLSAGARPRRRDDYSGGHQKQQRLSPAPAALLQQQQQQQQRPTAAVAAPIADLGRKRRHHQQHQRLPVDEGLLVVQPASRPQFCTPYGLSYSDHSYCKHHASGGWQRQSPQPVSQLVSPVSSAAAVAAALSAAASVSASVAQPFSQQQQLIQQHQQQQAFYTLNDDTDNLKVTWPEEAAA
ncbi:hypothetical protein BOX15_Mlig012286g2, partial [Macrostomum lignano]